MLIFFQLAFRPSENKPHRLCFIWVTLHLLLASIAASPTAHADEPPPFNKVCEEEYQGEAIRYVSDPDTNGFSRRHADICFTEDKTTLFVEFKDYKPNLNSCSWRTTLNKKGDGYYKKTDECEVRMKFAEHQAITEFPNHCEQQCGYNAHFYSDTLIKQATLDPSKEKLTLLQSYSAICEPIMPEIAQHIRKDGQFNIGPTTDNFKLIRIKYNKYSQLIGWITDLNNNGVAEVVSRINLDLRNISVRRKIYVLDELNAHENNAFFNNDKNQKKHFDNLRKRLGKILEESNNLDNLKSKGVLKDSVSLLVGQDSRVDISNDYDMNVIIFKKKQYLIISDYITENKRNAEINLLALISPPKNYRNLCNYRVNLIQ